MNTSADALSLYPWQAGAWQQLQDLRQRMPHAILLHGPNGIGKTRLAEYLAKSLLCERVAAQGHACGGCASCVWFDQTNHPDFRRVRPEALEEGDPGEAEGASEADASEADASEAKKTSKTAPSKEIKIDQIRALSDFMNISTHRQGLRVVALYPAHALNMASSNALLKTLEEPPPNTVFLLVTDSINRLLPTILSRCRKFGLSLPEPQAALVWLQQQAVADAASWLAEQGGAPLAAKDAAQQGQREELDWFLQQLMQPGIESALKAAEKLQKMPVSQLLLCLQRWLYDLFSYKLTGTIRYYPRHLKALATLAHRLELNRLLKTLKLMNQRRMIVDHPLAPKLFIEDMLLDYSALYV